MFGALFSLAHEQCSLDQLLVQFEGLLRRIDFILSKLKRNHPLIEYLFGIYILFCILLLFVNTLYDICCSHKTFFSKSVFNLFFVYKSLDQKLDELFFFDNVNL